MNPRTVVDHLRANVVAYIALAVALGGGGGYAIAATRSNSIHGCIINRTGELLIRARCERGQSRLVFNQTGPAGRSGTSPFVATGVVALDGSYMGTGFTAQRTGTGQTTVTLTGPGCARNPNDNLVVSIQGDPNGQGGQFQNAQAGPINDAGQFGVTTGNIANGQWSAADASFSLVATC